jgi:hypothetical protein
LQKLSLSIYIEVGCDPVIKLNSLSDKGEFVLVEYLIPPKSTATTEGEHVFFDIDVKGGEKGVVCMLQLEV